MSNPDDIRLDVIGDSGPFSTLGKSIGYRLRVNDAEFLLDCGAPIFNLLGTDGIATLDGVIGTHAHEDHKRWFSDLALFRQYAPPDMEPLSLLAAPEIIREFRRSSAPALEQTLSADSRRVVNFSFSDFVESINIGPDPLYRCKRIRTAPGSYRWRVVDQQGEPLPPDRARVVFAPDIERPRMLFRDPRDDIWVEPATYYSYDDERFYDLDSTGAGGFTHESGLTLEAVKSTAWHGPPTHSIRVTYGEEQLFFTSDTVYNPALWEELTEPLDPPKSPGTEDRVDQPCLEGDINDYIERRWSQRRLDRARETYRRAGVIVHDITGRPVTVHSDYGHVEQIDKPLILTHSPDTFTARDPLAHLGKSYRIRDGTVYEQTRGGDCFRPNALCYHKEGTQYFVGYPDEGGGYYLLQTDPGSYLLGPVGEEPPEEATVVERVSLYEEVGGEYYPHLKHSKNRYVERPDGRVEKQIQQADGSEGQIVEGIRRTLAEDPATVGSPES